MTPLRVLLIEDSPSDAKLVKQALKGVGRPIEVERVETAAEMRAALLSDMWDLVISDWSLPSFSALAALAILKESKLDLPFIIVSGTVGEERAIAAMRAGAHDYVLKDGLGRLAPVIERELREHENRRAGHLADVARREAELLFRRLFDSGITGVAVAGSSGVITDANDTFLQMVGSTRDDLRDGALSWLAMTPHEWHSRDAAAREVLLSRGSARPFEKEFIRRDGTRVPALVGCALLDEGRVLAVVADLTEQKRVEADLAARVRVAGLGADVGLALTAGETLQNSLQQCCEAVVRHLDAAFARIWTLSPGAAALELQASAGMYTRLDGRHARVPLGMTTIGSIARERAPYVSNDLPNDPRVAEPEWAREEGLRSFAGHPLLAGGQVVGVLAMFGREPTADGALTALASVADAIAVRIRGHMTERANVLLEEQLRQAQKMEAVGRLAGGVAHDFNNLLSVVLGYSEFAMADLPKGDPVRDDLEEIHRAGERAADLTRQLLMFSRQQVVAPRVLDLNEVLSGMHKMLCRLVGEDIELTTIPGASLGRVHVDPGLIEQVVMNLAVNARDAMPTGGKLTMGTANVELDEEYAKSHLSAKPGSYVMFAVSDTGSGMDKATQARIFEPFFTTKAQGKGTGLGLSTVFGIVHQCGGNIWVYSEPGLGTTFKVYLPRVDAPAEEARSRKAAPVLRGVETVLLVEDEEQVRDVARGILKRYGYQVLEARNGGEALLLCEKYAEPIHLLLSDVVMPGMSGPELARRLALIRPEMKVLCMSGYTDDAAVRHGVIDAAFAYLQKPITVETLTRKVREVLDATAEEKASE